jgi:hypothetical protein
MLANNVPNQIFTGAKTLNDVRLVIEQYPKIAGFVGPQFSMDLNYGPWLNLPHDTFCVAGPGAVKGVEDCFANHGGNHTDVITAVWQHQNACSIAAIGQPAPILQGRKPSGMNLQNFFCEFRSITGSRARSPIPSIPANADSYLYRFFRHGGNTRQIRGFCNMRRVRTSEGPSEIFVLRRDSHSNA